MSLFSRFLNLSDISEHQNIFFISNYRAEEGRAKPSKLFATSNPLSTVWKANAEYEIERDTAQGSAESLLPPTASARRRQRGTVWQTQGPPIWAAGL